MLYRSEHGNPVGSNRLAAPLESFERLINQFVYPGRRRRLHDPVLVRVYDQGSVHVGNEDVPGFTDPHLGQICQEISP